MFDKISTFEKTKKEASNILFAKRKPKLKWTSNNKHKNNRQITKQYPNKPIKTQTNKPKLVQGKTKAMRIFQLYRLKSTPENILAAKPPNHENWIQLNLWEIHAHKIVEHKSSHLSYNPFDPSGWWVMFGLSCTTSVSLLRKYTKKKVTNRPVILNCAKKTKPRLLHEISLGLLIHAVLLGWVTEIVTIPLIITI